MLEKLKPFIQIVLISYLTILLHLIFVSIFPYPLNNLNFTLTLLILMLLLEKPKKIFITSILIGFLFETYTSAPFGISMASILTTMILSFWLFKNILTQKSIYMVFVLSLISTFFYRLFFILLLSMVSFIKNLNFKIQDLFITYDFLYEIIITTLAITISYLIITFILKHLRPGYLSSQKYNWYEKRR